MAYIAADAIIQRLRELVQDGAGVARTIASTRLTGGLQDGITVDEQHRRGLHTSKPVEVRLDSVRRHPQRLTDAGETQIHLVGVTIRIVRTLDVGTQITDALRDDVRAQAIIDASAIERVLSWPPNLRATEAGSPTGVKGADLIGASCRSEGPAGEAQSIVTEFRVDLTVVTTASATQVVELGTHDGVTLGTHDGEALGALTAA